MKHDDISQMINSSNLFPKLNTVKKMSLRFVDLVTTRTDKAGKHFRRKVSLEKVEFCVAGSRCRGLWMGLIHLFPPLQNLTVGFFVNFHGLEFCRSLNFITSLCAYKSALAGLSSFSYNLSGSMIKARRLDELNEAC